MPTKAIALALALLATGCNITVRDEVLTENPRTAIIVAQTRRAQLISEVEQLERLLRRTVAIDARAVVQSNINRLRFEIDQLNAMIEGR